MITTTTASTANGPCTRPLPLPPVKPTTYAQARNLAQQYPEHAAAILRAPLGSQNTLLAPRTYAQARNLAAAQPEHASEILSRPLASNPPEKPSKDVVVSSINTRTKPRSPFRNPVRRTNSTHPRPTSKKPAGPRFQTQPRRQGQTENESPVRLSDDKKSRPSTTAYDKAATSDVVTSSDNTKSTRSDDTAQVLVSKSEIWIGETAVVPAVKLPALPAITSPIVGVVEAPWDTTTAIFSVMQDDPIGSSDTSNALMSFATTANDVSMTSQLVVNDVAALEKHIEGGERARVSVGNGLAHPVDISHYVDENAVAPILAPSSSPIVPCTSQPPSSLVPATAVCARLALLDLNEHDVRSFTKELRPSTHSVVVDALLPVRGPTSIAASTDANHSIGSASDGKPAVFTDDQTVHSPLSPSSLRITPTRRKSALELASAIAAQKPRRLQLQGTPPHTTVDRLRLAIAAERALSRRPDLAARINTAFASASAAPAVVEAPIASSMRFVRPAPQYAFKRSHPNNIRTAPAASVRSTSQLITPRASRAPKTPYGELLGYVEVDAW
ncbi:unnamed protein product [Peniophora sp. CBMAI 1063]|nr:unnamed protein product [Peniophora sp. CBMAI 1063]